jgi:ATP-dependent RNA helicase DDX41
LSEITEKHLLIWSRLILQHVINYTMPKEIEDYVHQIGRTGRGGRTGLATTFVDASLNEAILLDLKYLLLEAKQK